MGHVYAGTYESHPVAIKKHKMDGSMMDSKALIEFEFEVRRRGAVAVVPVYHAGGEGRSAYARVFPPPRPCPMAAG